MNLCGDSLSAFKQEGWPDILNSKIHSHMHIYFFKCKCACALLTYKYNVNKKYWNEHLEVLYALESTSYPVIVILSSCSRGTNLFASETTKIASRYGFASGVFRVRCVSPFILSPIRLKTFDLAFYIGSTPTFLYLPLNHCLRSTRRWFRFTNCFLYRVHKSFLNHLFATI